MRRAARRALRSLACRLIGHAVDPIDAGYGFHYCVRCHLSQEGTPLRTDDWLYLRWYSFRGLLPYWLRKLRKWARCPDCGTRFGRCDRDDSKHIPF